MLRKVTLALVAAASLSAMALAPTAASAGPWGGGWGGGWGGYHHHWGHGFGMGGATPLRRLDKAGQPLLDWQRFEQVVDVVRVAAVLAFVALHVNELQVAKQGDMKITTPTAILGVRGTTGVVDVPPNAPSNVKLYQDADGRVGRIEVFGRDGARVGELTQAATGYALQVVGQRLIANALTISADAVV